MYEVYVIAEEFRGVRTVAQHRMVNDVSDDIHCKRQSYFVFCSVFRHENLVFVACLINVNSHLYIIPIC